MVKEIRIYVEGGGDDNKTWIPVREGFNVFLKDLRDIADRKKITLRIIPCGPRGTAKNDFITALKSNPDAYNVLLVDSENPVDKAPWLHLKDQDGWKLDEIHDEQCHLMVQVMESWLIADIEALKDFYGKNFDESKIPDTTDVENIHKDDVLSSLRLAIIKGKYHKINHGPKILERLNVHRVRKAAPHCDRLFTTLTEKMSEPS